MRRLLTILVVMCLAAGCRATNQPVDPFFGRTTVEPPRTGAISGTPADLNYAGSQGLSAAPSILPGATLPGATPAPAVRAYAGGNNARSWSAPANPANPANTATPANTAGVIPPAYRNFNPPGYVPRTIQAASGPAGYGSGERVPPPTTMSRPTTAPIVPGSTPQTVPGSQAPSLPATPNTPTSGRPSVPTAIPGSNPASPAGSSGFSQPLGSGQSPASSSAGYGSSAAMRTLAPRPATASNSTYAPFPAYFAPTLATPPGSLPAGSSDRATEITDLPRPDRRAESSSRDAGVRLASATSADEGPVRAAVGQSPESDSYGHDPGYGRLRGKLEYSQVDRQWKLRYIPVDEPSDDFGGSVVIANPAALSGHERGELVELEGTLHRDRTSADGFAPQYDVAHVRRLDG